MNVLVHCPEMLNYPDFPSDNHLCFNGLHKLTIGKNMAGSKMCHYSNT